MAVGQRRSPCWTLGEGMLRLPVGMEAVTGSVGVERKERGPQERRMDM